MNIGIDVRLWNETGVGRYIRNLVVGLGKIDKKNTYTLFVRSLDKQSIEETLGESSKHFHFVPSDIRWHTLSEQVNFGRIINQSNIDLVHFPYFSVPLMIKKPFVVTIHDVIIHHFPTGQASTLPLPLYKLKHIGYRQVVRQAAKRSRKIIVPLHATKEEVVHTLHARENKVIVTEEGVDRGITPTPEAKEKVEKMLGKYTSFFLYVGNAYPHKNLPRLLEAFALYKQQSRNESTALVLVGKSDFFYKKLEDITDNQSVLFSHQVSDGELAVLYRRARGLVMPSLMEGFGLPVLEAMANGCPVLASNIPSLKEVCAENALYFDPLKPELIAKSLGRIDSLSSEDLARRQRKGKEKASTYSWKKMVKETIAVYESSLSI